MSSAAAITVSVQLFAAAREALGSNVVDVIVPERATIAELRRALAEQHVALAAIAPHLMFALDTRYADDRTTLTAGAQIAAIPPVSGG